MAARHKMKSLLLICAGGTAAFSIISIYKENPKFYQEFVMPAVHQLDPEFSHKLGVFTNKYCLLPKTKFVDPPILKVNILGKDISNPIGIAAGFDKDGEAIIGLQNMGFGFIEVGSVTPKPQDGNARPRVFRLPEDKAVINRYGFNSIGHELVYKNLEGVRNNNKFKGMLGINLGKNKESEDPIEDYVKGIQKFGPIVDYFVINISSPNTPGLRNLQSKENVKGLLKEVIKARDNLEGDKPPIFLKLAPDLSKEELKDIANVLKNKECLVEGLIISNTTINRPESLKSSLKNEVGGLSGKPLKDVSTEMISQMYKLTNGKITIIGVGGVFTGSEAYEKIKAGASAVQIYTALVYKGPTVVSEIKHELAELLEKDNFRSITEAVGSGL